MVMVQGPKWGYGVTSRIEIRGEFIHHRRFVTRPRRNKTQYSELTASHLDSSTFSRTRGQEVEVRIQGS